MPLHAARFLARKVLSPFVGDDTEAVMDHVAGAGHRTRAAAETLLVVDDRVKVHQMDGVGRAAFHAQTAGDAAYAAHRPGTGFGGRVKALVQIGAQYRDTVVHSPHRNDPAGAFAAARAAADALLFVHLGAAQIVDVDRVEFACLHTRAAANAAVGAEQLACVVLLGAVAAAAMDSRRFRRKFAFDCHVFLPHSCCSVVSS